MKIKIGIIKAGTAVLNAVYAFMKFLPVRKKVTMLSRQANKPSDEFLMVRKGIKEFDNVTVLPSGKSIISKITFIFILRVHV